MKQKIIDELLNYFIKENNYDIKYLKNDNKRNLLRGLINIREPKQIDERILKLEDKLLEEEVKEKNIIDSHSLTEISDKIVLWQGDIVTLKCDAIVNACNEYLLGCFIPNHSCIDNQIHTYAGIRLRLKCNEIMKGKTLKNGHVVLTNGYNLPCKYVIHTVGPQITGVVSKKDENDLRNCYINSLELAKKNNIRTIAFPCISTGVYGFPKDKASYIAYNAIKDYLKKNKQYFDKIIFNVFTDEDYKVYYENLK